MFDETKNNGENINTSENISDNDVNDVQDVPSSDAQEPQLFRLKKPRMRL